MRVYAEYFTSDNGNEYRKKTLLHFGKSTNLIGSAVLINPGSAKPNGEPNAEFINSFYYENHHIKSIDTNIWKTFSPDSTMGQLEKIFNGWYLGKFFELNGVIQLFNCFYLKNHNLGEAIKNYNVELDINFNESQFFIDKPVYFGWGDEGKSGYLKPIAIEIFTKYDQNITPIYDSKFENNCFYHPRYVNFSYNRDRIQKLLLDFFNLIN
ncbi:MAG: hypothetical protein KF816_06590 [Melioribacteraceae bacterium]|nr:hypothetical protein [Melioribacteraceae bacterium]